jgi:hypothetical protein
MQRGEALRPESGIYGLKLPEAASKQTSHHQENHGESELEHQGPSLDPAPLFGGSPELLGQNTSHRASAQEGERGQSEEEAGAEAGCNGKGQDPGAEEDLFQTRDGRRQAQENLGAQDGKEDSDGAAQESQHTAFHQEMAHQPAPAGAHSRPGRDLLSAPGGLGDEERGHVPASDDEKKAGPAKEHDQGRGESLGDDFLARDDSDLSVPGGLEG